MTESWTAAQVAKIYDCQPNAVRAWARAGDIPGRKNASDDWEFDPDVIRRHVAATGHGIRPEEVDRLQPLLTSGQVCRCLNVTHRAVLKWMQEPVPPLPCIVTPGGVHLFPLIGVARFQKVYRYNAPRHPPEDMGGPELERVFNVRRPAVSGWCLAGLMGGHKQGKFNVFQRALVRRWVLDHGNLTEEQVDEVMQSSCLSPRETRKLLHGMPDSTFHAAAARGQLACFSLPRRANSRWEGGDRRFVLSGVSEYLNAISTHEYYGQEAVRRRLGGISHHLLMRLLDARLLSRVTDPHNAKRFLYPKGPVDALVKQMSGSHSELLRYLDHSRASSGR